MTLKSIGIALVAGGITALLILVVGPFTFYASVVPILGPILPRPESIPKHASASYSWKGAGMAWEWERELPDGCARWLGTKSFEIVEFVTGREGCKSTGLRFQKESFYPRVVFGEGGERKYGNPCPFTIYNDQIAQFMQLTRQAKLHAETLREKEILQEIDAGLQRVDGSSLVTSPSGGCTEIDPRRKRP